MDTLNGAVTDPASAVPPAQGADQSASASGDLSQFVADPSAGASAVQEPGASQVSPSDEQIRHLQSLKDKAEAEKLALQYQLQQFQQQMQTQFQQSQPQPQGNPYDYNTDFPNWFRWESKQTATQAATEARKASEEQFQNLVRQAQEMSWVQQHPGIDVNAVKMFNRMNGIAEWNLDAGHKLMTMPSLLNTTAVQTAQQTINSFKNPIQGAQPVRAQSGGGLPQTQFSFQKMAEAYNANPAIEETWPEGLRDAFWKEAAARQEAGV